jgi:hypothetical protein
MRTAEEIFKNMVIRINELRNLFKEPDRDKEASLRVIAEEISFLTGKIPPIITDRIRIDYLSEKIERREEVDILVAPLESFRRTLDKRILREEHLITNGDENLEDQARMNWIEQRNPLSLGAIFKCVVKENETLRQVIDAAIFKSKERKN